MTAVNSRPMILNYKNTNKDLGIGLVSKHPRSAEGLKPNRPRPAPINVAKANEGQFYSPEAVPSPGRAALVAGLRSATDRRHRNGSPTELAQRSPSNGDNDEHQQRLHTLQEQHSYEQKRLWIQQQQELFRLQQQMLAGEPRSEPQNSSIPSPPQTPYGTNRPPRLLSQKQQEILAASNLLAQKQLNLRSVLSQQNIGTSTANGSVYQHGLPSPKLDSSPNASGFVSCCSSSSGSISGAAAMPFSGNNARKTVTASATTTPKTPTFNINNSPPRQRQSPSPTTVTLGGQVNIPRHVVSAVTTAKQEVVPFVESSASQHELGRRGNVGMERRGNSNNRDKSKFFFTSLNSIDSDSPGGSYYNYQHSGLSHRLSANSSSNRNYIS